MFLERFIHNISEMLKQCYKICNVNFNTTHMKRHQIWTTAVTITSVQRKSNNKRNVTN